MTQLEKDYIACEEVIKKASKTFYKAFSQLSDINQRRAIYAVYAYCRYADDVIDEANDLTALENLKNELDLFVKEKKASNYIFRALLDVRDRFYNDSYDFKAYYEMLLGQMMDYNGQTYDTMDQLLDYCMKVASSVGYMLTPILAPGADEHVLNKVSFHLGIAMQITNILRDIGEDYGKNRIYIPTKLFALHNYSKVELGNHVINENFKNLFDELAKLAFNHYDIAFDNLYVFPDETRLPLTYALVLYKEILNVIFENNYDVFSKKNKVSDFRKLKLIKEINKNE